MASQANYVAAPKNGPLNIVSAANTNRDGTGAMALVYTAGANGGRIDRLAIAATGTTTQGMLRMFLCNAAGTTARLIREVPVQAQVPSSVIPAWAAEVVFDNGLVLEATNTLRVSTQNAETFHITPIVAGDF